MHSDSHRFSWRGGEDESCRGCSTHLSHPEPENPARAVAHFHGATRSFTASGNDARRSVVDFGKAFKAAARSANDTFAASGPRRRSRSEEHTSELQSQSNLVCRLLLEKKKTHTN